MMYYPLLETDKYFTLAKDTRALVNTTKTL